MPGEQFASPRWNQTVRAKRRLTFHSHVALRAIGSQISCLRAILGLNLSAFWQGSLTCTSSACFLHGCKLRAVSFIPPSRPPENVARIDFCQAGSPLWGNLISVSEYSSNEVLSRGWFQ